MICRHLYVLLRALLAALVVHVKHSRAERGSSGMFERQERQFMDKNRKTPVVPDTQHWQFVETVHERSAPIVIGR